MIRDGDALPDGPEHPGRARPRRARDLAPPLHVGHDRAGRRASRARTPPTAPAAGRRRCSTATAWGDRTLGVMPLYHTMGIHSLLAMHLVGGCFVPQARWDAGEALRLIEEERITLALPRADALPRPRPPPGPRPTRDVSSVRALGYAGAAMTSTLVRRCVDVVRSRRCSSTTTARPRSTPSRSDATSSRSRVAPAGPRSTRGCGSTRAARSARTSARTRRSPATGTGPTPTRRRSATAGTAPATPGTSTRTATSGSTGGSTT